MRIVKQSTRTRPRLSLILLDWGVRESFHLLHYLKNQTVPRDTFEVLVIEYYSGVSEAVRKFESEIDTWILLEMPDECYYHKHLMYNAGILLSNGEILMIGDSDAMVRPAFVETICDAFENDPLIVYHMDQFRNVRRDLYPFNYPSFDDVLGDGCINHIAGRTKGILDDIDPMHTRNYGACMCARREDVIAIGGADEDPTYLGHVCGPYDMTFRLMNFGRRLVWETEEYLYHTWHPGTDGTDNYLGPHDGRNMSTTAFQALCSGRIPPLVENEAIRRLRANSPLDGGGPELDAVLIDPNYPAAFHRQKLAAPEASAAAGRPESVFASYRGFDVFCLEESFYAVPQEISPQDPEQAEWREDERVIQGDSFTELRDILDSFEARFLESVGWCNICAVGRRYAVVLHELGTVDFRVRSHRENPRIVWADSLGEARDIAHKLNYPAMDNGAAAADGVAAPYTPAPSAVHLGFDPMRPPLDLASLERRLSALESGMSGIYRSRTWRTLTRAGGALQSAARALRLRSD